MMGLLHLPRIYEFEFLNFLVTEAEEEEEEEEKEEKDESVSGEILQDSPSLLPLE